MSATWLFQLLQKQPILGEGLIDEIFPTIVEGKPLLISVPEVPVWQDQSGESGSGVLVYLVPTNTLRPDDLIHVPCIPVSLNV